MFQSGNAGRPKGSTSALTRRMRELAENMNVDPFEILLHFANGDWKALGYASEKYISNIDKNGATEKFTIDPAVRAKSAAEAVQYIAPKLRSIDYSNGDALQNMTPEQKLEALKTAANLLENQIKANGSG